MEFVMGKEYNKIYTFLEDKITIIEEEKIETLVNAHYGKILKNVQIEKDGEIQNWKIIHWRHQYGTEYLERLPDDYFTKENKIKRTMKAQGPLINSGAYNEIITKDLEGFKKGLKKNFIYNQHKEDIEKIIDELFEKELNIALFHKVFCSKSVDGEIIEA